KTISKRVFAEAAERTGPAVRLAAYSNWTFTLTGRGEAERLEGCGSSANLFDVLGARAAIGRTFAAGEDRPGRDRVAVISDRLWRRTFASDAEIVGRTVALNGERVTILGVMPAAFEFPQSGTDVWRPLPFDAANARDYGANYLTLVGRLSAGTSVEQARDLI